ncbi:TetR/AcrR family transcriptional regulator [Shewanella psychrotolerans]|uniref:TetR/AcrR family transcriptional regulator n=1 Tax=Shewanella psychrotolerans TaxID=2864206 RepID=UPI001C6572B3|nr:TetR/AcrR family transcriptional regulator [Shewanella psychrotolerans]QYK01641.1 TetR/AcrR family transcriptional regulator [Shewanella psychrotolerans]
MAEAKNRVGRPSGDTQNREKLIVAARTLFVERDYAQVTIRDIAALAGTDPGLIRYYFGSKESLFSTMIRETALPVIEQLYSVKRNTLPTSPGDLLQTYYQVMSKHPHFPRLMFRIAGLDQSLPKNQEIARVFYDVVRSDNILIFKKLKNNGMLRDDVDAQCAQLSFFAMMIFPFLVPDNVLNLLGIELNPEFLQQLATQNTQLLHRGIMKQQGSRDEY